MMLLDRLRQFFGVFGGRAPLAAGEGVLVAFSGGADSTALLRGLARLAPETGWRVHAAHLDHGLDPGSAGRAEGAAGIAAAAGVPFASARREVGALARPGESAEVAARRIRYLYLEEERARLGARWVATAHHRGDQAETVALRLLYGSGVLGLAGILPVQGRLVRPLLPLPRAVLEAAAAALAGGRGPAPLADPTNGDLAVPRNRLRHRTLPALARGMPGDPAVPYLEERLARLAVGAARAGRALGRRLGVELPEVPGAPAGGAAVRRADLARLPEELRALALALLHRRAGAPYPASRRARAELARQLAAASAGRRTGCDCGRGWRWEVQGGLLLLRPPPGAQRSVTSPVLKEHEGRDPSPGAPQPFHLYSDHPGTREPKGDDQR